MEDSKIWNVILDQVRSQAEMSNTITGLRRDLEIADDRLCWTQRDLGRERRRIATPERRRVVIIEWWHEWDKLLTIIHIYNSR